MPIVDETNEAQEGLQKAIEQMVTTQFDALLMVQKNNEAIMLALGAIMQAVIAPRQLVLDVNGMPVGVTQGAVE